MTEEGIRFLIGIAIIVAAYGLAMPYFMDPEKYFIKPLRPAAGGKVTHARLLVRSFVGGVAVGGLHFLAHMVAFPTPLSVFKSWDLAMMGAGALMVVVGSGYAYFRLVKYRRLPPDDPDAGAFVLRAPFRDELKTNWAKRVDKIARMVFTALAILVLTLIIATIIANDLLPG